MRTIELIELGDITTTETIDGEETTREVQDETVVLSESVEDHEFSNTMQRYRQAAELRNEKAGEERYKAREATE